MRGGAGRQGNRDTGGTGTEEQDWRKEKHTSYELSLLHDEQQSKDTHIHPRQQKRTEQLWTGFEPMNTGFVGQ